MTNLLIRDISAEDVAGLDARAAKLGLSRADFLRRLVRQAASSGTDPVTTDSISRMSGALSDLGNVDIMRSAWS